jgi:hypothetical protein
VNGDGGAVVRRTIDRDLEFARQERELGMQRRPLANDFRPWPRVFDLVRGDAGELVGGGIADAIAAGLDGVHPGLGQLVENIRRLRQLYPIELDVLARGEMAIAAIVAAGDPRQRAKLVGTQQAVRDGDPQHVGMKLQIEPVAKPQRLEFVLGQLAGNSPDDLVAELHGAFANQCFIEAVIGVHGCLLPSIDRNGRAIGPDAFPQARRRNATFPCFEFDLIDPDYSPVRLFKPRRVQAFPQLPLGPVNGGVGDIVRPGAIRLAPDNRAVMQPVTGDHHSRHGLLPPTAA